VLKSHLERRLASFPNMTTFIYGHTQELEFDWRLKLFDGLRTVDIFNTKTFQRNIDDEKFLAQAGRRGITNSSTALQKLSLEQDFPPAMPP